VQVCSITDDKLENPEFMLPNTLQSPAVFHLFGDAAEPSSLMISENDTLDFLIAFVSKWSPVPNSVLHALKRAGESFLIRLAINRYKFKRSNLTSNQHL